MSYSTLNFLNALDESKMTVSAKLIRNSLMNGTYPGRTEAMLEATADIVSITLIDEPGGKGVSVKQADGHEYRYTADDTSDKYNTPEKLCTAANKLLKFRSSGFVLGWLSRTGILYYGSKKEAKKKKKEKAEESISREAQAELLGILQEKYPDSSKKKLMEKMESFLVENKIETDEDFYNMPPKVIFAKI